MLDQGELDNGYTINYTYSSTNMALSSSNLKLDMGDSGNLHFGDGSSATGIQAYYDKMPTAGEQVWDDLDGQANGIATMSTKNTLGYSGTFVGIGVSAAYNKDMLVLLVQVLKVLQNQLFLLHLI